MHYLCVPYKLRIYYAICILTCYNELIQEGGLVLKSSFMQPENIILDEISGKVKLVDFGAVQDAAAVTLIGSTVVGTVCMSSMKSTFKALYY